MGSRIPSHQLSNGLYVSGRPEHHKERQPTILSRAVPYTGGDVKKSGELGKMFSDHPPPVLKSHRGSSSSSGSFRSAPNSGSGPLSKRASGSGPISGLHPTGLLLTSGPLGSSIGRRSGQLEPPTVSSKGKTVYGPAVTTLGFDDVRLGFKISKTLMWMLLVIAVIGLMVGTFLMLAVKKPLILVAVLAVLVVAVVIILWNCGFKKRRMMSFLRNYPDAELRGAVDGQFVKVTGIVTCGSIPLEISFQKVPRCVYVSTELYEYKGWGGKPANPKHRCFSWGCRNSEKYLADFYISDFQSGLRAVVKAGYGAKVAPFVKETTVIDITKENLDSSPSFVSWLADRSLSSDDRVMRLKEGYIKEGSTASVMGVVRRHDNVLMIVPPTEPVSTGCRWACGLFPTYVEGLVLTCDESQNAEVIPV
ncbi:hypothetical protein L1987_05280 [Smallanthus sonchifolius]|uniref:Uncharacterized protein n=1 Tax=Smallanthus sonchifolius TaxID=185202 RepID=A0ACB9JUX6_9ASTR|nr:hypothetical protein L1987_05280 [Smallanthus sonchifolius]